MYSKKVLENLTNMAMAGILATDSTGRVLFGGSPSEPLCRKADLRQLLIEKRRGQDFPALLYEEPGIFWASFFDGDCYYLSGPVSTVHLDLLAQHRFYRKYNIPAPEERKLSYLPLNRYLSTVAVIAAVLEGNRELDVGALLAGNGIAAPKEEEAFAQNAQLPDPEQTEGYHHTYRDEKILADYVQKGDLDGALAYNKMMLENAGRVSEKSTLQSYNMAVIAITLNTRAVLEAGVSPDQAYGLSDFYLQQLSPSLTSIEQQRIVRSELIELVKCCQKLNARKNYSNYVEAAKSYVARHYREKISIETVAGGLGISTGYLSRLFHSQEGLPFQQYVVRFRVERAANLLKFSDSSLAEIGSYVGFPSQSYFTERFRQVMQLTPREYRNRYQPAEFKNRSGQ